MLNDARHILAEMLTVPRAAAVAIATVALALLTFSRPALSFAGQQDIAQGTSIRLPAADDKAAAQNDDGCDKPDGSNDDKAADAKAPEKKAPAADDEITDAKAGDDDKKTGTTPADDQSADARDAASGDSGNDDDKPKAKADNDASQDSDGCDQADDDDADPADSPADDARPSQETRVDLYRDTQGYRTTTVTTNNQFTAGNFWLNFSRDTVMASDPLGAVRSEDTMFSFATELNEQFGIGGGFGNVYSQGWSLPIGSLKGSATFAHLTVDAGIAHDLLATTAQTIRNRVMQTDVAANVSYEITKNFVPTLEFHQIYYSDHNSSIGVEFAPQYTFQLEASQLQVGYHFAYQSFATNPNSGYWAPQRLISNKLASAWIFDRNYYFGRLEAAVGPESAHQIDSGPGSPEGGFATSATAAFGIRPERNTVLQCYFTGDRSPGWNSTQTGLSLKYTF